MNYSRIELEILLKKSKSEEFDKVVQNLSEKIFKNNKLSLAEEHFICRIIEDLKNSEGNKAVDIFRCISCKNFLFRNRYLLYLTNLNGLYKVKDIDGQISNSRKIKDIIFLQEQYEEWNSYIRNKNNGHDLINHISSEVKKHINKINRYYKTNINYLDRDYQKKSIVLHSKFIYLIVKEYYQELGENEQIIEMNGNLILIDSYSYVHTMFRHYSKIIKEYQVNKSYHFDQNIGYKTIPDFIFKVFEEFKKIKESNNFDFTNLNIIFNKKPYAIWLKNFTKYSKGNHKVKYKRVQTFYPIESKNELEKIINLKKIKTNFGLEYFV